MKQVLICSGFRRLEYKNELPLKMKQIHEVQNPADTLNWTGVLLRYYAKLFYLQNKWHSVTVQ